jgi:hypothetical protein
VAAVVKYADNIMKGFATSGSIVLNGIVTSIVAIAGGAGIAPSAASAQGRMAFAKNWEMIESLVSVFHRPAGGREVGNTAMKTHSENAHKKHISKKQVQKKNQENWKKKSPQTAQKTATP